MALFGMTRKKAEAVARKAYQTGDFTRAISAYEKMIQKSPEDVELFNNLGIMYLQVKQLSESEEMLRKAIDLTDDDVVAAVSVNNLGRVHLARGEYSQALECFQKAFGMDSFNPQPWYNVTVVYREQDKKEDVFVELQKIIEEFPDYGNAHNDLGSYYFDKGEADTALKCYEKCVEVEPHNFPGRVNLIKSLCDMKRFPEATPHLEAIAANGIKVKVNASEGKAQIFFNDELIHECEVDV